MAFSVNYWQITASHLQHRASAPNASKILAGGGGVETPAPQVKFANQFTDDQNRVVAEMSAQPAKHGPVATEPLTPSLQAMRLMQQSPNLTLEQVKAILKVGSF